VDRLAGPIAVRVIIRTVTMEELTVSRIEAWGRPGADLPVHLMAAAEHTILLELAGDLSAELVEAQAPSAEVPLEED
jgi:hypothetical protein